MRAVGEPECVRADVEFVPSIDDFVPAYARFRATRACRVCVRRGQARQTPCALRADEGLRGGYEVGLKRETRVTLSRRFRNRILPFVADPWPA